MTPVELLVKAVIQSLKLLCQRMDRDLGGDGNIPWGDDPERIARELKERWSGRIPVEDLSDDGTVWDQGEMN